VARAACTRPARSPRRSPGRRSAQLESEALITAAAAACRVSVSAFVLEAATEEAGRILGRADLALMPADQVDALIAALDEPDEAPRLAKAAQGLRRYSRR
jgi:uncharacterized protein (DUF1778 family)